MFLDVWILVLNNSNKELRLLSIAHHSLLGDKLSPGHQLEEIQSHLTLMLTSRLRLLNVIELQNSLNSTQISPLLPCNQEDVCTYINKNLTTLILTWSCHLKMMFTPRSGQLSMLCLKLRLLMSQLNNGSMMIRMDPSIMLPTQLTLLRTMKDG